MIKGVAILFIVLVSVDMVADGGAYMLHVLDVMGTMWHNMAQSVSSSIFSK